MEECSGAKLVVQCLEALGVARVFGIPGAKIDAIFNALLDSTIEVVVCRHEQNAAFMAALQGRLTGKPGVVIVTSGPGVSNLATGLLTATTEGDPILALAGNVPRSMLLRSSHQNTNSVKILEATTKFSVEVNTAQIIPEVIANAYRLAMMPRSGACFVSFPQDVLFEKTSIKPIKYLHPIQFSAAGYDKIFQAVTLLQQAKSPLVFLGEEASRPECVSALQNFLRKNPLPVIGTYQAAGSISREFVRYFIGRVGLFKNQIADNVLEKADIVICIGFNTVEYDPEIWNSACNKKIIHLDFVPANLHNTYQPMVELLGDIPASLESMSNALPEKSISCNLSDIHVMHDKFIEIIEEGKKKIGKLMHPLRFISELRSKIDDETRVICDVGSVYMWVARYFLVYKPRHLLFSNGQQTLGVALPWALSASLLFPKQRIISISGDGGFLFSAMELETAVRQGAKFIHFVWRDGSYNMVLEQQMMKYGRKSAVDFGRVNLIDFAESFGAKGFELKHPDHFSEIFSQAQAESKPVLIDVPIDYTDNPELFSTLHENAIH